MASVRVCRTWHQHMKERDFVKTGDRRHHRGRHSRAECGTVKGGPEAGDERIPGRIACSRLGDAPYQAGISQCPAQTCPGALSALVLVFCGCKEPSSLLGLEVQVKICWEAGERSLVDAGVVKSTRTGAQLSTSLPSSSAGHVALGKLLN